MINNFESFSGDYDPQKDPYKERSTSDALDIFEDQNFDEVIFFQQFEEALLGILQKPDGTPSACYSQNGSINILINEHGLSEEDALYAIQRLLKYDLGPSGPCFLDTSIVEKWNCSQIEF